MFKILKYIIATVKKLRFVGLKWPGSGCWNVKIDIDDTALVNIHKTTVFNENCVIRVRDNANLSIGNFVFFNDRCLLTVRNNVSIGNNILFGPNVMIFDHDHDFRGNDFQNSFVTAPIVIEDNVWVGANVTILKGSIIRKGAVIGANSVVTGEVPEDSVYTSLTHASIRHYARRA